MFIELNLIQAGFAEVMIMLDSLCATILFCI